MVRTRVERQLATEAGRLRRLVADTELRMSPTGTDDFWEDLLDFIEQGKVIPVIGEHAVSFGEGDEPLYPWLARELAKRLGVTGARLAATPTLNDVAREHLLAGGERNAIYTRLSRILREGRLAPGGTLRDLAGIVAFNLYLTTTFDLLTRSLSARSTPCVLVGRRDANASVFPQRGQQRPSRMSR